MAKININNRGIEENLKSLVKKNLIVEGSKLSSYDILNNSKRKKIHEYIVNNPGTYFNKILKDLAISNHVVVWHLNMLLKFELIKKETIENHAIYFNADFDLKNSRIKYFTSKQKSKIIIEYLKNNNLGITKTQLSADLRTHINTMTKYLQFLEEFNIVVIKKLSNKILYFINDEILE
jgi:predicted transcriptional regulator